MRWELGDRCVSCLLCAWEGWIRPNGVGPPGLDREYWHPPRTLREAHQEGGRARVNGMTAAELKAHIAKMTAARWAKGRAARTAITKGRAGLFGRNLRPKVS